MEPILEIRNLRVVFTRSGGPEITAVDGVSFRLYPGEILGIVGESGAGKSTLAKAAVRLVNASGGSILLNGCDVTRTKGAELRKIYKQIQMVFQSPAGSFDPRQTLGGSIAEGLRGSGISKKDALKRAGQLLEQCGLSAGFVSRFPHEVSGGQCQRAAIARSLAADPQILVCDEATSSLDAAAQQQIIALLRSLRASRSLAYIFICHDLALVQSFCDRVLVMQAGRIVEEGPPGQVIAFPRSDCAKRLVAAAL